MVLLTTNPNGRLLHSLASIIHESHRVIFVSLTLQYLHGIGWNTDGFMGIAYPYLTQHCF